ncbi:SUPPRESSOR OF GAMMA RESPONSE 1-like [Vicia villosa]|uniref:SUPPRESSOR OF GAMMA RESPONSE 1-like n=1 Tax=Vicia villosa TaxID=3911 RepID=UPI00273CC873|nr:SUPPRESSOR OF GAMMA RESPONSE 1-like [Vicia villosa]
MIPFGAELNKDVLKVSRELGKYQEAANLEFHHQKPSCSWLVDKSSIAAKIWHASGATERVISGSNPTTACPNCQHVIDNRRVTQEWPGLPRGVKFDPSDQEIMLHLLAKVGQENLKSHPLIDEFIPTIDMDEGICYTHPRYLPGVALDGSVSHFFHRAVKAYNSGSRKRRRVNGQDDLSYVRWHKTGKTKPILLNGVQIGSKKIMVLYSTQDSSGKTNWIMHQYHLGTKENEKHGEYVASKVFYQQPEHVKLRAKGDQDIRHTAEKESPITPNSVAGEPHRFIKQRSDMDQAQESHHTPETQVNLPELESPIFGSRDDNDELANIDMSMYRSMLETPINEGIDDIDLSQNLLDSQKFAEAFPSFKDLLPGQSLNRDGEHNEQHSLATCAHLGQDQLKNNIEDYQNLDLDTAKKNDIEDYQNLNLDIANKNYIEDNQNLDLDFANMNGIEDYQNLDLDFANMNGIEDYQNLGLDFANMNGIEDYQNLDLDFANMNGIEDYLNLELDSPTTDFGLSHLDFDLQDSYLAWDGYKKFN